MNAVAQLFVNLALSIVVEGALLYARFRSVRFCYASLLCNLLTNPLLNLLIQLVLRFSPGLYWAALVPLEIAVVFAEAYVYRLLCDFSVKRALLISLLLNAASYGAGALFWSVAG